MKAKVDCGFGLHVMGLVCAGVILSHDHLLFSSQCICEFLSVFSACYFPSVFSLHFFAFMSLQVFGFQAGLTCQDKGSFLPLIPIIPSFSTALYGKLIQLPALW